MWCGSRCPASRRGRCRSRSRPTPRRRSTSCSRSSGCSRRCPSSPTSRRSSPPTSSPSPCSSSRPPSPASSPSSTTCRASRCRKATPTGSTTGRARSPSAASRPTSTRPRSAPPSTGFPTAPPTTGAGPRPTASSTPANLGGVEVSQGTADVASRSVEALGGTFNFLTDAPETERTYTASVTLGENDGERYYMRVDTGSLFDRETRAWLSAGRQTATDWVHGAARNEREHLAAKLASSHGRLELTSYFSYDQIPRGRLPAPLLGRRLRGRPPLGPPHRRLAGGAVPQPVLPPRLVDLPQEHLRLSEGRLGAQRRQHPQHRRLLPPQPGPRRLAAAVHRRRDGRRRRARVRADGRTARAGRRHPGADPLRRPESRGGGAAARLRVVVHLPLLRSGRARGRPRVPSRGDRGAVVPPQPLRQGPARLHPRRGVDRGRRRRRQHPAGRPLVRGLDPDPRPRLAPHPGPARQRHLRREPVLAAVRLELPAAGSSSGTSRTPSMRGPSPSPGGSSSSW